MPDCGAGPALADVLAGAVECIIETLPAALGHIRAGRLRALAVSSAARWLQELCEVMNTPELRDRLADLSVEGTSLDPAATAAFVGREVARWRQVVRDNNVTAS